MEDAIFSSNLMMGAPFDSTMDFVNELLFDGCWLETTDGSEFLNPSHQSTSTAFLDSPFPETALEPNNGDFSTEERSVSVDKCKDIVDFEECCNLPWNQMAACSEPIRWWIGPGPGPNPGPGTSVMQRLMLALKQIKDFTIDKEVLVQLWVPVNRGGRRMLTTSEQPFSLNPNSLRLANYRDISVRYHFSAEENSEDIVGLPGRVFLGKVPEWTPDVRFFRSDEYSRVNHAQQCDVRGTLAIPVFEQGSRTCLGVIEVVMTTQKIQYRPELESVCKALEAVNLTSSIVSSPQSIKVSGKSYEAALPEINNVLKSACETHKLPLGQTWVPCIQQGKEGCRHSNENYTNCVSTVDDACYIGDPGIKAFHEACSEHHLLKGQGVVGEAFMTNQPCFSPDITSYTKTEYPLSHHARMFDLHGTVAIRLRCIHTGTADFVLEFFLPKDCNDGEEQRKMLNSLSVIIQQVCCSLRVVTDQELVEETSSMFEKVSEVKQHQEDSTFNEASVSSVDLGKTGVKKRSKAEKKITLDVIRQYFAGSLKDAARSLGVCPTTLKRICRQNGIQRWPSRTFKKVDHSLKKLQHVIDSVHNTSGSGTFQIGTSFYSNFPDLSPKPSGIPTNHQKPEADRVFTSPSTSCSQSSSSSQSYSSERHQHQHHPSKSNSKSSGSEDGMLKRVRSDVELNVPRSRRHKQSPSETVDAQTHRVKVQYGDDNIRLRMLKQWRFKDLADEIATRFNIDDMSRYDIKYLDDDSEWVLLTCDADLEECIDVFRSSEGDTIKLKLQGSHKLVDRYSRSFCPL